MTSTGAWEGMNDHTADVVGVGISKAHPDAHRHSTGESARFANAATGFDELAAWVGDAATLVVYESTGPWHRAFEERLAGRLSLARVNALLARRFAQAMGVEAKTDAAEGCWRGGWGSPVWRGRPATQGSASGGGGTAAAVCLRPRRRERQATAAEAEGDRSRRIRHCGHPRSGAASGAHRRSGPGSALASTTILRMTAAGATFAGLPRARSSAYLWAMSGLQRNAPTAAM